MIAEPTRRGLFALLAGAAAAPYLPPKVLYAFGERTTHILQAADMPSHTHGITDPGHTHGDFTTGAIYGVTDRYVINVADWRGLYGSPGR